MVSVRGILVVARMDREVMLIKPDIQGRIEALCHIRSVLEVEHEMKLPGDLKGDPSAIRVRKGVSNHFATFRSLRVLRQSAQPHSGSVKKPVTQTWQ